MGGGGPSTLYDPVMSALDVAVARELGFDVLRENDECRTSAAGGRVLMFMPHCCRRLYSNAIEANWAAGALPRLAILGNSFASYAERVTGDDSGCRVLLAASRGVVREQPVGAAYEPTNVLNDTSLHTFRAAGGADEPLPPITQTSEADYISKEAVPTGFINLSAGERCRGAP